MKALLFDLDGTLTDTLPLYIKSYDFALKEQGFNFSEREIVTSCFGKTEEVICEALGIPELTTKFQATYFSHVHDHFKQGRLFPGVLECLKFAKEKGLYLGVISFAYNWYVEGMLNGLDIHHYFNIVIGHNDVTHPKPEPEAIFLACHKLGIETSEAVMIGDSKSDILMGNAAKCQTVLFYPPGYDLYYDLNVLNESKPTMIINSVSKLINRFLQ